MKLFKTISWLETKRYAPENIKDFINYSRSDLTNCEKILTHWLCYITDRQMRADIIWKKGGYVLSEMVNEYSREKSQSLDATINKYCIKDKDGKLRFISRTSDFTFASRFMNRDFQCILQTLEVLDKFKLLTNMSKNSKRNIVAFIAFVIKEYRDELDLLHRIACALHILSYQLNKGKRDADQVVEIFGDKNKFDRKLSEFKRDLTNDKKRLWCSIRDYKKGYYHFVFKEAVKEIFTKDEAVDLCRVWDELPMEQIELPGDVWNNNKKFRDNLFADVLDFESFPNNWNMPTIVRNIYEQVKNDQKIKYFYPEQFDVTFDFVPRMCEKELCNICIFSKEGPDLICCPNDSTYCYAVLISCGYLARCSKKDCVIKKGISRGLCRGISN